MSQWEALWKQCARKASTTGTCTRRLREHLLAHLVCPGRHTVSALITVFGKQFQDWSADYSLYAKERVHEEAIFAQVRKEVEALGEANRPLCVALDDTILRKPPTDANASTAKLCPPRSKSARIPPSPGLPSRRGSTASGETSRSKPSPRFAGERPEKWTCGSSSSVRLDTARAGGPEWPTPSRRI